MIERKAALWRVQSGRWSRLIGWSLVVLGLQLVGVSAARAAGDANTGACPNESMPGFQASLPDCRAYELASPAFKAGQRNDVRAIASDGSRLVNESYGAVSGVEHDSQGGALYGFARSGAGWATSVLSPAAALFPAELPLASSTDLEKTLWGARRGSQSIYAEDLYVRQPDGTLTKVGPMTPPSADVGPPAEGYDLFLSEDLYAGASSDLSHVLFEIRASGALWPGDTTASGTQVSLYEYIGVENSQPRLVGVEGAGHLISNCGTTLGAGEADEYNSVARSGQAVFFTAVGHTTIGCEPEVAAPAVDEVYARLGGVETAPISEPTTRQCSECQVEVKAPAQFQGASEDGSKAFFLTQQELLPGATTNNLYEYDANNRQGSKVVRVSIGSPTPEVVGVSRVSEDGSHVYFVAKSILTTEPDLYLQVGHQVAVEGQDNLYVFERDSQYPGGHVSFVATLAASDEEDWQALDIRPAQATPEGRFFVFTSAVDLTPGDSSTQRQVFEYDAREHQLVRVSIGQLGDPSGTASAEAHASSIPIQLYTESQPTTANNRSAVSGDGATVVFSSTGSLTPTAERASAAGAASVYEYHSAGTIANGNVYLISDGSNPLNAEPLGVDGSGKNIFFETVDSLLPQDVDTQYDVYDARSEGGLPTPHAPSSCAGEECRGPLTAPPVLPVAGSITTPGGGNLSPPSGAVQAPPATALTRAQHLTRALGACRKLPKRKQRVCETRARKAYGPPTHRKARK